MLCSSGFVKVDVSRIRRNIIVEEIRKAKSRCRGYERISQSSAYIEIELLAGMRKNFSVE